MWIKKYTYELSDNMENFEKGVKGNIHIHIQTQGKRHLTIVEGLDDDLDLKRICKCWLTEGRPTNP